MGLGKNTDPPPLRIGNRYLVPDADGDEIEGMLVSATMIEAEKLVYGVFRLDDGRQVICTVPVEDHEIREYKQDPDNYFCKYIPVPKKTANYEDCFNFLYKTYSQTPKETLLEFMSHLPNKALENLRAKSQDELARIYCERIAVQMMEDQKKNLS